MPVTTRTVEEISADLTTTRTEAAAIQAKMKALGEEMERLKASLGKLTGTYGGGKIRALEGELVEAKRRDADADLPKFRTRSGHVLVLVKVTPARIFGREVGRTDEVQWRHDGTRFGYGAIGNIAPEDAAQIVANARKR